MQNLTASLPIGWRPWNKHGVDEQSRTPSIYIDRRVVKLSKFIWSFVLSSPYFDTSVVLPTAVITWANLWYHHQFSKDKQLHTQCPTRTAQFSGLWLAPASFQVPATTLMLSLIYPSRQGKASVIPCRMLATSILLIFLFRLLSGSAKFGRIRSWEFSQLYSGMVTADSWRKYQAFHKKNNLCTKWITTLSLTLRCLDSVDWRLKGISFIVFTEIHSPNETPLTRANAEER